MDSISQAALGAAIGEVTLGKKIGPRAGAVIGAIVATIPDLDVILLPFLSPLERLSMHRGYSHSIMFSVLGALLIASILSKVRWTKSVSYIRLAVFSWLCLFTHMLLDAFTSYGTLLYLPWSDERVGFDSVNIVDPLYTLPLIIGIIIGFRYTDNKDAMVRSNYIGLGISTLYLLVTLGIKTHVTQKFASTLSTQDIPYQKLLTEPVGMGSVHWYGVAKSESGIYIGDYSYWNDKDISYTYFPSNDTILRDLDTHLVDRIKWFAKDYYHVVQEHDTILFYNMQVDMQGITELNDRKAPTRGYFIIVNQPDGSYILGSGRHGKQVY